MPAILTLEIIILNAILYRGKFQSNWSHYYNIDFPQTEKQDVVTKQLIVITILAGPEDVQDSKLFRISPEHYFLCSESHLYLPLPLQHPPLPSLLFPPPNIRSSICTEVSWMTLLSSHIKASVSEPLSSLSGHWLLCLECGGNWYLCPRIMHNKVTVKDITSETNAYTVWVSP